MPMESFSTPFRAAILASNAKCGPGGSTAGGEGLKLAYDLAKQNFDPKAVNRVILMTDGDFNVGVADPAKLKDLVAAKRKEGTYLSVYGFGRGNYNDAMMQTLAQWYGQGKVKPLIHQTLPMSDLKQAYAQMSTRSVMGKLVMVN